MKNYVDIPITKDSENFLDVLDENKDWGWIPKPRGWRQVVLFPFAILSLLAIVLPAMFLVFYIKLDPTD